MFYLAICVKEMKLNLPDSNSTSVAEVVECRKVLASEFDIRIQVLADLCLKC